MTRFPAMVARSGAALFVLASVAVASTLLVQGAPPADSDDRFGPVLDFSFDDSRGGTFALADLKGQPWVGVPFFLRCTGPCPSITRDIREHLHDQLDGTDIKIVSFSLDPEIDTADALASYAESIDVDPDRWIFLSAETEEAMHDFVRQGLKVPVSRNEGVADPGLAITHGTRMPVIDPEGRIAGWYDIADPSLTNDDMTPMAAQPIVEERFRTLENRARAVGGYELRAGSRSTRIPLVNACLNGLATVLLVLGFLAIKGGHRRRHEALMKLAFLASALFLCFYLYYHFVVLPISGGPTKFNGTGAAKAAYLALLASHVVLAAINLPMVLRVLWLAHREDWVRHRRLARWTFPIWLYVSVTGVVVYLVLYPFNPAQVG